MKKSQLRNIIRDVIKETHSYHSPSQNHNCNPGRMILSHKCGTNGSGPGGSFLGGYNHGLPPNCMTIDGQTPQVGDVFKIKPNIPSYDCDTGNPGSGHTYNYNALFTGNYKVTHVLPCYDNYSGTLNPPPNEYYDFESATCCGVNGCTNPLAINYNPNALCDDGSCIHRMDPEDPIGSAVIACNKCCCKPDESGRSCIPGTQIYLVQNANPCKCPPGMVDNLCKNPIKK